MEISDELKDFVASFSGCGLCTLDVADLCEYDNCIIGRPHEERVNFYADEMIKLTRTTTTKETIVQRLKDYYELSKNNASPLNCSNCSYSKIKCKAICTIDVCVQYRLRLMSDFFMLDIFKLEIETI